jgi:hypothetical protein
MENIYDFLPPNQGVSLALVQKRFYQGFDLGRERSGA